MSDAASFRLPGAVDLGGPPPPAAGSTAAGAGAGTAVLDVTEATFQRDVVDRSQQVPVVLDFWAEWCGPCRQLSPILERLAADSGGRWVLAKIDVDANQRIATAAGVQGIPAVKAVVGGQIVGEFTGALPEPQVRDWIEQLLTLAAERGVAGAAAPAEPAGPDPLETAYDALAVGDLDRAEAELRTALERAPGDAAAKVGLAQIAILRRAQDLDEAAVARSVDVAPDDLEANFALADIDVLSGQADAAFDRLLALIRRTDAETRDQVKERLLSLFDALDPGDPVVLRARRELANAFF